MSTFKHKLIRDSGCHVFNSYHGNSELFWLCFLGPEHMSGKRFVRRSSEDFENLWCNQQKVIDVFNVYSQQCPNQIESDREALQYKLNEAIAIHKLQSIVKQPYAKSEIEAANKFSQHRHSKNKLWLDLTSFGRR